MQSTEQEANKVLPSEAAIDTGGRIRAIMDHYQLGVTATNERLGYHGRNSKLHKLLSNESRPGYETLVDIMSAFPDVSADWLLIGYGPMLRPTAEPHDADKTGKSGLPSSGQVVTITVDKDGNDNLELVPIQAQAGYALQHNEAVFVQDLPRYRVPGFEHGKFRAFEVAGDSMEPTLNHRDIVVCSYVDNWRLLVPDDIYVVVTTESVMLKRIRARITGKNDEVVLHSDNAHRRPYPLDAADITELWRVRGYISSYLPSAPDITIERLWEVIEQLGFDKGEVRRHLAEDAPADAPR